MAKHSLHSSCYTASFSNVFNYEKHLLDDDLLFGLSHSFNFMYYHTNLPLSGKTFSVLGTHQQGIYYLSAFLGLSLKISAVSKQSYLNELSNIISQNNIAIVEISVREYMSDNQTKELFTYIKESNVNHYVTVHKIDSNFIHFHDNLSFTARKLSPSDFLNAVYPQNSSAIYPSEGRIFYYERKQVPKVEITEECFMRAVHHSAELFLSSNFESNGWGGLKKMAKEIDQLFVRESIEKNKKLFYYFCILAGNGGLYRRDYIKFLKHFSRLYPEQTIVVKEIISLYITAQKKWRKLSKMISAVTLKDGLADMKMVEVKDQLEELISIEQMAMEKLWYWSENRLLEFGWKEQVYECKNSFQSLEEIINYFLQTRVEFELIITKDEKKDLAPSKDDRILYWTTDKKELSESFYDGELNYCFKIRKLREKKDLDISLGKRRME